MTVNSLFVPTVYVQTDNGFKYFIMELAPLLQHTVFFYRTRMPSNTIFCIVLDYMDQSIQAHKCYTYIRQWVHYTYILLELDPLLNHSVFLQGLLQDFCPRGLWSGLRVGQ